MSTESLYENPKNIDILGNNIERLNSLARSHGLDPYPVHFEIVPAKIMYEFGAYGLPGRFSHWTFGRTYQQIKTMYDYGLSKIYELVINTNPANAFLLENNSVLQNTVVVGHVLAHVDLFKHNIYFSETDRGMLNTAALHSDRLRDYEFEHGTNEVETFLDAALSIEQHVDRRLYIPPPKDPKEKIKTKPTKEGPYDELWRLGEKKDPNEVKPQEPEQEPDLDIVKYLADHADKIEDWQRDILYVVWSEQRYFIPQMKTKVMNEGWASYWHARLTRELDLTQEEFVDFARMHANVLGSSRRQINPYAVGMRMFEDIEKRWDDPTEEMKEMGFKGGEGKSKIFEVRELETDASLFRNYLTEELVEELDLYLYKLEGDQWVIVDKNWEHVRDMLVTDLTNHGVPVIGVKDGDFKNRKELLLVHSYDGQELDVPYAKKTLEKIYSIWKRPVYLDTVREGKKIRYAQEGAATLETTLV